ncbi:MAG: right-handed parallel beta-helix repeat-containing protein, partial [Burkholderiales bacterium]|nr:right-handed parallel beta-helix repeat-containing protein [Opitutaceae bacterium]
MKPSTSLLAILLAAAPAAGLAADLFVATNGANNTNTNINGTGQNRGSLAFPYQTIDYAADRANPGDTIYIRAGIYRENVTPTRSGTVEAPIVFRPYNNEAVTISGLQLITPGVNSAGQWEDEDGAGPGQVYRIQLTANYGSDSGWSKERMTGCQVFVDGEPMSEARWPNTPTPMAIRRTEAAIALSGAYTATGAVGSLIYDALYRNAGLDAFAADVWQNGIIIFAPGSQWYRRVSTITGNTPAGADSEVRFTFNPYSEASNREDADIGDPFFLMGRRAALDAEREFFFDTIQGTSTTVGRDGPRHMLYLRLPGSVAPAGRVIEMRRRTYAIDLTAVSNLRFENLRVLAGRIRTGADTANCTFSGIEMEYGAYTWQEELGDTWDASVHVQGSGHQFLDSSVCNTTGYGFFVKSGNNIVIRNSVVSEVFITGVQLETGATNVRVENVTVYNIASSGISGGGKPHQVLYSHGYLSGLFATDCATLGAGGIGDALGSEWAYNWMHTALGAVNSSRDWYGTPAIRLDAGFAGNGPSNFLIHHNVVWNTTQPGSAISIWALRYNQTNFDDMKVKLYNNSVDQQIGFTETFGAATGIPRVASLKTTQLINNVTGVGLGINSSSTDATGKLYITDMVVKNNLFPNRSIPDNPTPPHSANRQGATGWIDLALPPYGFQLSPTSQAINTGAVIPGVTDGFVGAAPDIGAFEYGLKPFVPGAKIRARDLAGLTVTPITGGGSVRFLVAGLPAGRSLPESFRLKVGAAGASTDMTQNFDFVNHVVTASVTAPSVAGADQPVQISLDGTTFTTLPATVTVPEPGEDVVPAG